MLGVVGAALHQRVLVITLSLALIVGGLFGYKKLNIEACPDPVPPLVGIVTQNFGPPPVRKRAARSLAVAAARQEDYADTADRRASFVFGPEARQQLQDPSLLCKSMSCRVGIASLERLPFERRTHPLACPGTMCGGGS